MDNQITPFTRRPELGSQGKIFQATSNHFLVKNFSLNEIFNYEINISPIVFAGLGRQIFKRFSENNKEMLTQAWHDGQ